MANRQETYAAIRALLASLGDPFTRLLDPDQYAALRCGGTAREEAAPLWGLDYSASHAWRQGAIGRAGLGCAVSGPAQTHVPLTCPQTCERWRRLPQEYHRRLGDGGGSGGEL